MSDRKLVLPGDRPKRGDLTILVPRGMGSRPVGECYSCGIPFFSREEGERHMGPCARKHQAELMAQAVKRRIPIFDPENWDPEVERHMRKVGKRMIREGRLEVKPNERAGF